MQRQRKKINKTITDQKFFPSKKNQSTASCLLEGEFKRSVSKKETKDFLIAVKNNAYTAQAIWPMLSNASKIWLFYAVQALKYQKNIPLPDWANSLFCFKNIQSAVHGSELLPCDLRYLLDPKRTTTYKSDDHYSNEYVFIQMNKIVPEFWATQVPDTL